MMRWAGLMPIHARAPICHDACVPAAPRPMHATVETGPCASGHVNARSVARTSKCRVRDKSKVRRFGRPYFRVGFLLSVCLSVWGEDTILSLSCVSNGSYSKLRLPFSGVG